MAKLLGIAWREAKRAPMQELSEALVEPATGVNNDFRGRPGTRQVSVLCKRTWDEVCDQLGATLSWTARRSNLLVDDLPLELSAGRLLRVGNVTIELCVEVDPCSRMDEAHPGLREALIPHWRGGAAGRVIDGGIIRIGDEVELVTA